MLDHFVTAVAGMILISCAWLAVQRLWQRHFPEQGDGDALAGRSGCHGCHCGEQGCERVSTRQLTNQSTEVSRHAP